MPAPTLVPILTGTPGNPPSYNVGMAETFSWIPVDNDRDRPIFARAGYITNLKDISISLSASNVNIGGVELTDGSDHSIVATVVRDLVKGNSLQVLTQNLESTTDNVTIGDHRGNSAIVNSALSALCVYSVPYSFTKCETRNSGNPSFVSNQILIHNNSNNEVNVILTLTSGLSCAIPIGKNSGVNHTVTLNVAVSQVNDYSGCSINFFA